MYLDSSTFKTVVASTPLFALDLLVINENEQLLLGKRLNPPAKDFWFVPGGRVLKNEPLAAAFERLCINELGIEFTLQQASLLGVYEHFYMDSIFAADLSTHYITAAHVLRIKQSQLHLPLGDQHSHYRWIQLKDVNADPHVHDYTKCYLPRLLGK